MCRPRLLLADDHPQAAKLLRGLLEHDFDVVGDVRDGAALVAAVDALMPDVIVSDVSMPTLDGVAATRQILERHPGARVVLVTVFPETVLAERGLAAGALGYVSKLKAGEDLVPAVHAALGGRRHLGWPFAVVDAAISSIQAPS